MQTKSSQKGHQLYTSKLCELAILRPDILTSDAHVINHGVMLLCRNGSATILVGFRLLEISEDNLLTLFPGDVVKWVSESEDFEADVLRYDPEILREASLQMEHTIYEMLRADALCTWKELVQMVGKSMFSIFRFYFSRPEEQSTDRIVVLQLRAFFLGFYDTIKRNMAKGETMERGTQRVNELFNRFMELVKKEYRLSHDVNHYADSLCISRKYLGIIVKKKTGLTPKKIIDEHLVLQLQLSLRTTQDSIKQIAAAYNFSDVSFFVRYFREHTGMTPQQFRRKP